MRATRAYIAGFGTAGSLLAGAAILFFFASAVVSFRGWPQVGGQSTPLAVIARQTRPASSHTRVREFTALVSAQKASVTAPAAAGTAAATGGSASSGLRTTAIVSATPVGSHGGHGATFTSGRPTAPGGSTPPGTPCSTCGSPTLGSALGAATQAATTTLGSTVAGAGSDLGSVVSGLTGAVASKLGALSPGLARILGGTGHAVGATVSAGSGGLGGTVSGVGKGLSGLLGQH